MLWQIMLVACVGIAGLVAVAWISIRVDRWSARGSDIRAEEARIAKRGARLTEQWEASIATNTEGEP